VPEATKCTAAKRSLFDHLVGAAKQIDREGDAELSLLKISKLT
jgi:hypothetical protein